MMDTYSVLLFWTVFNSRSELLFNEEVILEINKAKRNMGIKLSKALIQASRFTTVKIEGIKTKCAKKLADKNNKQYTWIGCKTLFILSLTPLLTILSKSEVF